MESNKVFGALLLAGVIAMISIILSGMLVEPKMLAKPAYPIPGVGEVVELAKPGEIEPISGLLAKADVGHGELVARQCDTCHTFTKGGANGTGPNNYGVVGGKRGHVDAFAYSSALKNMGGEWDYESLNKFLAGPQKFVPGTKMSFTGVRRPQDRVDLIAWLRTQSDNPPPLPPADAAPAPAEAPAPAK